MPHPASVPDGDDVFTLRSTVWESSLGGVLSLRLSHSSWRAPLQTDATRTCELLVGLRDVTVLGVDERLRQITDDVGERRGPRGPPRPSPGRNSGTRHRQDVPAQRSPGCHSLRPGRPRSGQGRHRRVKSKQSLRSCDFGGCSPRTAPGRPPRDCPGRAGPGPEPRGGQRAPYQRQAVAQLFPSIQPFEPAA